MGQFSWMFCDKPEQNLEIGGKGYLLVPPAFGNNILETYYEGHGSFKMQDAYELVAMWNRAYLADHPEHMLHDGPIKEKEWYDVYADLSISLEEACEKLASQIYMEPCYFGIEIACRDEDNACLPYPIKISSEDISYEQAPASKADPFQGGIHPRGSEMDAEHTYIKFSSVQQKEPPVWTGASLFDAIVSILKEKSIVGGEDDILDYHRADRAAQSVSLLCEEFDVVCKTMFGSNEGVYTNVYLEGRFCVGNTSTETIHIGTFKTLQHSKDAVYAMYKLAADFYMEAVTFIDSHIDDFIRYGVEIGYVDSDGEKHAQLTCHSKEKAFTSLRRMKSEHETIYIRDNVSYMIDYYKKEVGQDTTCIL